MRGEKHQQPQSERQRAAEAFGEWFANASLDETQELANQHGDRRAAERDQRR